MIPWHAGAADIEAILAALIISPDGIMLGVRRVAAQPAQRAAVLARLLYEECFIKGLDEREPPRRAEADVSAFVAELSARNTGTGRVSAGWRLTGSGAAGRAIVVKDGLRRSVETALVRGDGDVVDIHAPKEDASSSEHFYYAYGDALPLAVRHVSRARFYVNVASDGAPALLEALTRELNAARVPFSLKCFRDPHDYYRRDGAVVYHDTAWSASAGAIVRSCAAELGCFVRDATPIFTERVARGIASAPEPEDESYGQRCCRILAAAILAAVPRSVPNVLRAAERMDRALIG